MRDRLIVLNQSVPYSLACQALAVQRKKPNLISAIELTQCRRKLQTINSAHCIADEHMLRA